MKKSLTILISGTLIFFFAGCGNGKDKDNATNEFQDTGKRVEQANPGIIVPSDAYKECRSEYFEIPTEGEMKDCSEFVSEPVCAYFIERSDGSTHNIQFLTECQACRNFGRLDPEKSKYEFAGIAKGACSQGAYRFK